MTEQELLLAGCEKSPGDNMALLVAADWMAEHGDPVMEAVLRWMAKWDKRPARLPDSRGIDGEVIQTTNRFMWTCFGGIREGLPHAALPRKICVNIGFREWQCHQTWPRAVEALATAIRNVGEVMCEGDPNKVDAETLKILDKESEKLAEYLKNQDAEY